MEDGQDMSGRHLGGVDLALLAIATEPPREPGRLLTVQGPGYPARAMPLHAPIDGQFIGRLVHTGRVAEEARRLEEAHDATGPVGPGLLNRWPPRGEQVLQF